MKKIILFILCSLFSTGCATNYFPLKNEQLYKKVSESDRTAVVLPFMVNMSFNYLGMNNTQERAEKKQKEAHEYFLTALKESLQEKGVKITDYIANKELNEDFDEFHDERLGLAYEILKEYSAALFSIKKNLEEEKGKGFDYSLGVRTQELAQMFDPKPDMFIIMVPSALVMDLAALESNGLNTFNAIISLGMSSLYAGSEDATSLDIVFVDAQSGDIIWLNSGGFYGKTILKSNHVKEVVKGVVAGFKDIKEKK